MSREEWDSRNRLLAESLQSLIEQHVPDARGRAMDVGCQKGGMTDHLVARTQLDWVGIDPALEQPETGFEGIELLPAWAHDLPFEDGTFSCITLANVYEHVEPELRSGTLRELLRVLEPNGVVVGQIPNPYFPIEAHSRLPFMGWLPASLRYHYWKLSPVPSRWRWEHDFHVVTARTLRKDALAAGFEVPLMAKFNYPLEAVPHQVRWIARALRWPMRIFPWAWQFVLQRPDGLR